MSLQVLYKCDTNAQTATTTLPDTNTKSFKCELCGMKMAVDPVAMSLSAHGHTAKTIKHSLRQVKTVGVET